MEQIFMQVRLYMLISKLVNAATSRLGLGALLLRTLAL